MWNKSTSLEKKEQLNASETLLKFANYGGHILLISNIVLWQTTLYFCAVRKKNQKPFTRIFISWPSGMILTTEWGRKGHTVYLNRILKIYSSADNA